MRITINIPDHLVSEVLSYLVKKELSFDVAKTKRSERPTAKALNDLLLSKNGNISQTAIYYCVSRMTIYRWLEEYNLCLESMRQE